MYLFILESIGTAELLLVGLVALIIFGPRKLPEMMHKVGKIMAEFRKTTGEFKESWEKEAALDFKEEKKLLTQDILEDKEKSIVNSETKNQVLIPEVRDVVKEEFDFNFPEEEAKSQKKKLDVSIEKSNEKRKEDVEFVSKDLNDKQNWL